MLRNYCISSLSDVSLVAFAKRQTKWLCWVAASEYLHFNSAWILTFKLYFLFLLFYLCLTPLYRVEYSCNRLYDLKSLKYLLSSPLQKEKAMAPHSSTLAWKIPWTAEPGKGEWHILWLGFEVIQHHFWRRQWHPTPVLLPGKSHGWRSLVGCSPWGR